MGIDLGTYTKTLETDDTNAPQEDFPIVNTFEV